MENTHFEDCCGLTDSDNHYTTARDIALMAQELITHYPQIKSYTTIWMENITHVTMQGSKEFGLANTNKLLKQYPYTTGLKQVQQIKQSIVYVRQQIRMVWS